MTIDELQQAIREAYSFTDKIKGNYASVREASLTISAELARAGYLKAQSRHALGLAKHRVSECEDRIKATDAALYLRFREELDGGRDSKGQRKFPTEGTIAAAIQSSDDHELAIQDLRDAQLEEIDAQRIVDLSWDLVEALKVRSTMINSLSADRRAELSTDLMLKKQAAEEAEDREAEFND